jgi:POT family proton-dependent oligopeptide transporter
MERTVFYGGIVVMLGHLFLAVLPGLGGLGAGMVLIAVGSGALKATASSLLGTLYRKGDPRADGGFTLFYLGINLGAFLGPLITGFLQDRIGFHVGFGAAAVGMALGLTQYAIFRRNLGDAGKEPTNPLPPEARKKIIGFGVLGVLVIVAVAVSGAVSLHALPKVIVGVLVVASVSYFAVMLRSPKVEAVERTRLHAFIPLFIGSAAFWSLFLQMFTTLAAYSKERMNWNSLGPLANPAWIGSLEPIWIIVLSPVFAALWTALGVRAPTTPKKFAYGVMGMGGAFLLFLSMSGEPGRSSPALAVFGILALFAVSELMLSPIGLSVSTKLAPEAFRAQMMALYFLSLAIGAGLSGYLAQLYSPEHEFSYFGWSGAVVIVIGLIILALTPWIERRMEGVH